MASKPIIVLVTGIMASGKSTVAQLLAEQFEKSVHLRGDIFRKMIVRSRKEVRPEAEEEELRQLRLRYRLAAHAAETYVNDGFTVIVQDVIIGPMLKEFVSYISYRPFYVVVLCPDPKVVEQREAERSKKGYGIWSVEKLDGVLRKDTPRMGMWLDSSALTASETVEAIWERMDQEASM